MIYIKFVFNEIFSTIIFDFLKSLSLFILFQKSVLCDMNVMNSSGKLPIDSKQHNPAHNSQFINEEYKATLSSVSRDGEASKISYRPLTDVLDNACNELQDVKKLSNPSYSMSQQNKLHTFEPEMTSTPMSLSRASSKNIPDVVQPVGLNSLVQTAAYDTKDKYEGPVVKVTIQNPRPYIPMSSEFPPATKALGKTSETLTKSSYSETTLTRLTCNSLSTTTLITEVSVF